MSTRRDLPRPGVITAGAPLAPGLPAPIASGSAFFPQSVASGDPRPESVILWPGVDNPARGGDLVPAPRVPRDGPSPPMLSRDPGAVAARPRYDRCARVKLRGLQPATTY